MRKRQIGFALAGLTALIYLGVPNAAGQSPGLAISGVLRQNPDLEAGPSLSRSLRVREKAAATFDTVFCRSFARLKIERAAWSEGTRACTLILSVDSIWVTVEKSIGIVLPSGNHPDDLGRAHAKEILCAHERDHSLLHEQIFFQTLEPLVKEVFQSFPKRITVLQQHFSGGEEPAVENRWDAALSAAARVLEWILDDFDGKAAQKISEIGREAGEAYDFATDHGRQGPDGGWPTIENQLTAAQEAIQNFKLQTRY